VENKELQIIVSGQKQIETKDWQLQIAQAKAFWENLKIEKFADANQRNQALDLQKNIKKIREYIKLKIDEIDDVEIANYRKSLIDCDKLLASKNGDIDRANKTYKLEEQNKQIEDGFSMVISQPNYPANFDVYRDNFEQEVKGKNINNYMEVAQKVACQYSDLLERDELKFNANFNELKLYCNEIEYIITDDYLKQKTKDIVSYNSKIENIKENLLKQKQDLDAVMKLKADKEAERLKAEQELAERNERNLNETMEIINQSKKVEIEPLLDNLRAKNSNLAIDKMMLKSILSGLESKITQFQTEEVRMFVCEMRNDLREFLEKGV
jgi:hypothetical protein